MGDAGFALQVTAIALGALVLIACIFLLLSWLLQLLAASVYGRSNNGEETVVAAAWEEAHRAEGERQPRAAQSLAATQAMPVSAEATSQPATAADEPVPSRSGVEKAVTSPIPGTVIAINVGIGASVKAGEVLLIVESMKIQNEIKAPKDGTVLKIHVQEGANVRRGERLVTMAAS
ncbi:MAG: biotin/lipoyl-containing protein [Chloroflexota bacterium]|nr:biotin/lipoyl-containing protein [Chloroflexota bacterium]